MLSSSIIYIIFSLYLSGFTLEDAPINPNDFSKTSLSSPSVNSKEIETALKCVHTTVYYESRGEPIRGQAEVAKTLLFRAYHTASINENISYSEYLKNVCKEMYKPKQFSFISSNRNSFRIKTPSIHQTPLYTSLILEIYNTCNLNGISNCNSIYPYYFHEQSIRPKWNRAKYSHKVGRHLFYTRKF